jgi:endoglucanase
VTAGALVVPGPLRAAVPPHPALSALWSGFSARFLLPEGRVVDTGNRGISHSEGQGWALLCAERCADRAGFDRILGWTRAALARPADNLLAWRHVPGEAQTPTDRNNASDGDIFTAAALLLAARRWGEPAYEAAGTAMARDVLRLLLRQVGGRTVLLPGLGGFEAEDHVILNPSYYAFPVLPLLARAVPDPAWLRLVADGIGLIRQAAFGRWALPPDWLRLGRRDGQIALATRWPPRFSYDALRVPLYMAWAGLAEEPVVGHAARFWAEASHPLPPAWVNLETQALAPYPASGGVALLGRSLQARRQGALFRLEEVSLAERDDYYGGMIKILITISIIG